MKLFATIVALLDFSAQIDATYSQASSADAIHRARLIKTVCNDQFFLRGCVPAESRTPIDLRVFKPKGGRGPVDLFVSKKAINRRQNRSRSRFNRFARYHSKN